MKKVSLLLKACGNGTYGLDCGELCGHCLDQKDCHNVNGSCLIGCKNGFWGPFCKLRKLSDKLLSKPTSYTINKFQMLAKYGVHTLIRSPFFFQKLVKMECMEKNARTFVDTVEMRGFAIIIMGRV